ncbi:MAG: hypothetical protein VKL39_23005 [Leptolyngbyaceae bacterium]|nr:hypothetical protein [Leptolyngbyaceae bacterium]
MTIQGDDMRYLPLVLFVIIPGVAGVAVFGHYALVDWAALELAYQQYDEVRQSSSDLSALFAANAQQNIHRINVFAEGVWVLLSAILAAIGLHGVLQR